MPSIIDGHAQRTEIIDAINAQRSVRDIAKTFSLSVTAVQTYRTKLRTPTTPPKRPHTQSLQTVAINSANSKALVDKLWAEAHLVRIIERATAGKVADLNIARAALRDLYEANGWMAPKRTESLNLNLHAMPPAQLAAALRQILSALPASARAELAAAEPDLVEIVGEVLPPAEVGNQTRESE